MHVNYRRADCLKSKSSHARFRNEGYTLLELIIVLMIIVIAAGLVGLTVGKGFGTLGIRSFTKDISSVLRYARNHAVSEKKTYCFVINREDGVVRLFADDSEDSEDEESEPVVTKPIPDDVQITLDGEESDTYELEFFPHGSSTGGTIKIINDKGTTYFINVNRITGKIEVERQE